MYNSDNYSRLMSAIIHEGLHNNLGLRYLFDLSTRLQLWNEDYKAFMGMFGCDYGSLCAGVQMGKEPAIAQFQKEFKENFEIEHKDEVQTMEHRLIAAWSLYLIKPDKPVNLETLIRLIDHWLKHLQGKNINVSKVVEHIFTINTPKSMTEQTYVARVVMPFIRGVNSAMPPVTLALIGLLGSCKNELAAKRVIAYVQYNVDHKLLSREEALDFLTKPPYLMPNLGNIAMAMAKHQNREINQQLQILLKSLVEDKLSMKQMVSSLLYYVERDDNSYATQLGKKHLIAECTEVLVWMQAVIKEPAKDCMSNLLPTTFFKEIIKFRDIAIYKHLLFLFTELMTNPYIFNEEFLRLQSNFMKLKSAVQSDLTLDKSLQEDLEAKANFLQRYIVLHNLEHRRIQFNGEFATDLRAVCAELLQQPQADIEKFKEYLTLRLNFGNLDAAGKTICTIYLQCIFDAAYIENVNQLVHLEKYLAAKKAVAEEPVELPVIFKDLPEPIQEVLRSQLWGSRDNLREILKVLHGKPVEQVSREARNLYSILFAAFEAQIKQPDFFDELDALLNKRIVYFNQKEETLIMPEKCDEPKRLRHLRSETKKFDRLCKEGQDQLTELFSQIQNNYSTYSGFILALLNLDGSHRIWFPAILALASVNKKLFQELFERAMNDCRTSPIAAKSMIFSTRLLCEKKKFDADKTNNIKYFKQLFIDEYGAPRPFTFKVASESAAELNRQWLKALEQLLLDFDPVTYFSKTENFYKTVIMEFLLHCDQAGCEALLKLMEKFFLSSKLESGKAEQLYGLLEQCDVDLVAIGLAVLKPVRSALETFLRQNMLIRVHYYIENRSAKRLDSDFESRFQEFLKLLKTGKVGDLAPFQKWGHSQRFSTYITVITHSRDETIAQAKRNYRQFLYARVVTEKDRFAHLNIRVQVINRRILLSLLPNEIEMKEKIEKVQSEMEQFCKQYADDLRDKLPKHYNESLMGILWLTGFSQHARQMVTRHIGSNQPFQVGYFAHYFFALPAADEQMILVTGWLWEDYITAKNTKVDEATKLQALCDWINRSCMDIRQKFPLDECDALTPCLAAIINADLEPQQYETPKILIEHPVLTMELMKIVVKLRPQMRPTCFYLTKQVHESVEESRAAIAVDMK